MSYILQILHHTDHPTQGKGENIIELTFEKRHQVDAELRRHQRTPHRAQCETYIIQEADRAIRD